MPYTVDDEQPLSRADGSRENLSGESPAGKMCSSPTATGWWDSYFFAAEGGSAGSIIEAAAAGRSRRSGRAIRRTNNTR